MSQDHLVKLVNKATGTVIYTTRNKKQVPTKLALKKFDKKTRQRVTFKEGK